MLAATTPGVGAATMRSMTGAHRRSPLARVCSAGKSARPRSGRASDNPLPSRNMRVKRTQRFGSTIIVLPASWVAPRTTP